MTNERSISLLEQARRQRRWTQKELSESLGVADATVRRGEQQKSRPTAYHRQKLCAVLQASAEELGFSPYLQRQDQNALFDPSIPLPPAIPLLGRENTLALLREQICALNRSDVTVLTGLPGVGKSALAITLAHDPQVRRAFHGGVLWAHAGHRPDIASLFSRWGTLLGIPSAQMARWSHHEERARALRTAIGLRSLLLVIDDVWNLEDALALKIGGPNCACLLTTRSRCIASDITIERTPIVPELGEQESVELLRRLVPQEILEVDGEIAHELVRAVGGLPLALILMGNYLRRQAHSRQQRRIQAALERLLHPAERLHLSEPLVDAQSHPSVSSQMPLSLHSVIAATSQRLDEQTSAALSALSVFPSKPVSFSEEAALAVAACDLATIDQLTDCGLLESSISGRYTLHPTIADYARLHLTEEQTRLAYAHLLAYIAVFLQTSVSNAPLLKQERPIIQAALDGAQTYGLQDERVRMILHASSQIDGADHPGRTRSALCAAATVFE